MNVLGNGGSTISTALPQQLMQNIQQVKGLMGLAKGNPMALMQQNPQVAQVMQMCKGQNPRTILEQMCKEQGIDMNALLNALKN